MTTFFQILANYCSQTTQPFDSIQSDLLAQSYHKPQKRSTTTNYSGPLNRGAQTPGDRSHGRLNFVR